MKFLKVLSEKCEVFSAADVTAVDMEYNGGRLKVGEYHPVQAEVGSDGTYTWVRIPVSYTHLDVYKRQEISWETDAAYAEYFILRDGVPIARSAGSGITCLLYTSRCV